MEATNLMDRTLVINKVIYKGKIFKAFIITNQTPKTVNKDICIQKVLAVSEAHLSHSFVIDALLNYFLPKSLEAKSCSIEKLLSSTNDVQYILDIIKQEENTESIDMLFYTAINAMSVEDVIVL